MTAEPPSSATLSGIRLYCPGVLLAYFIGLGVYRLEARAYRLAIQGGATPAAWWPPLIAVIGLMIVLALLVPEG